MSHDLKKDEILQDVEPYFINLPHITKNNLGGEITGEYPYINCINSKTLQNEMEYDQCINSPENKLWTAMTV